MINQSRANASLAPVGFLNPKIYPAARTSCFTNITSGTNGAYQAGAGYNLCTGLGTPNIANLIAFLTPSTASTAVAAWGANASGQLGTSNTTEVHAPTSVLQSGALAGKTVVAVASGTLHSLALTSDGLVYAWGDGTYGALGNYSTTSSSVPVAVNTTSGVSALAGKTVVAIAAGAYHSLALASDGTVYSWGNNANGELGNNSTTSYTVPVAVNTVSGTSVLAGKTVTSISAGGYHSLALASDGTVYAWGSNADGELGTNSTVDSYVPVAVNMVNGTSSLAGKTVTAISAGRFHGLALASDGAVHSWGYNAAGALGNNTTSTSLVPVAVNVASGTSALAGKVVTAISAGGWHNLSLANDGKVYAWGNNANGQIGNNSTVNALVPVAVNTVSGTSALAGKTVTAINAEEYHSMALASDGTFTAWGSNYNGQLGNNTTTQSMVPVGVSTALGASALYSSTVYALGLGNSASSVMVVASPPVVTVTSVGTPYVGTYAAGITLFFTVNFTGNVRVNTSGGTPSLALTLGRNVVNANYLSGSGTSALVFSYQIQPGMAAPIGISLGNSISLNGGSISDANGWTLTPVLTGVGSTAGVIVDAVLPLVTQVQRSSPLSAIATGPSIVWKVNLSKQVSGVTAGSFTLSTTGTAAGTISLVSGSGASYLVTVNSLSGAGSLRLDMKGSGTGITDTAGNGLSSGFTGGETFSLVAATAIDSWGANASGQLGNSYSIDTHVPTSVIQSGALAGKTVVAVATGYLHSLALTSDGLVYAWGDGTYGALGNYSTTSSSVPVAVNTASGISALAGKTVVAIAAGAYHSLALASDGTVYAWGNNASGELGNNTTTSNTVPVAVNMLSGTSALAGKSVIGIAAGGYHSLALASDGTVYAWGYNADGELGANSTVDSHAPVAVNTVIGSSGLAGKSVTAISAGRNHGLALASDGTVYSWGYNAYGALGNNSTVNSLVPVAVSIASGTSALAGKTVTAISAGGWHSLALASDGTVCAWGNNGNGEIGNNTKLNSMVPMAVNTVSGTSALAGKTVTAISGGLYHSMALASDGTAYAWGSNYNGQLGNNSTNESLVPVGVNSGLAISALYGSAVYALGQGCSADHVLAVASSPIPLITSVGVPNSGAYRAGATLSFTVLFSGPVNVNLSGGTPFIALTLDSSVVNAVYASGSGTNSLVFSYVVRNGDTANSGITVGSAITPNGGSLSGNGGVAALLTLNGIGPTTGIVIDPTRPTVVLGAPSSSALVYGGSASISVTYADVNFSSSNLSVSSLMLNTTGTANCTLGLSGIGTAYTISLTNVTGVGTLSVTIPAGAAWDTAGNLDPGATSAIITVSQSYAGWSQTQFTAQQLAQPSISGPAAINGQDGLPNLVKYALGLDPKQNATTGLPVVSTTASDWVYTYSRPSDRTDITYAVEVSTDLVNWATTGVTLERVSTDGVTETWQASYPLASAPNLFFRLRIILP